MIPSMKIDYGMQSSLNLSDVTLSDCGSAAAGHGPPDTGPVPRGMFSGKLHGGIPPSESGGITCRNRLSAAIAPGSLFSPIP
jgi:hypothetical protein